MTTEPHRPQRALIRLHEVVVDAVASGEVTDAVMERVCRLASAAAPGVQLVAVLPTGQRYGKVPAALARVLRADSAVPAESAAVSAEVPTEVPAEIKTAAATLGLEVLERLSLPIGVTVWAFGPVGMVEEPGAAGPFTPTLLTPTLHRVLPALVRALTALLRARRVLRGAAEPAVANPPAAANPAVNPPAPAMVIDSPAALAHDLGNLYAAILGHVDMALEGVPRGSRAATHLRDAAEAVQHATALARAAGARREAGPVDLPGLMDELARVARGTCPRSVTIETQFQSSLPVLQLDRVDLQRVLHNLMVNAVEAIGLLPGRVRLSASRVTLDRGRTLPGPCGDTLPAGVYVCVRVADNGAGMSPTQLDRLFERGSSKGEGRGIGLQNVRGLTRRMACGLGVESTPGLGTTFTLWLPAQIQRSARVSGGGRLVVLVVDDDATMRNMTASMIAALGHATLEAADGEEAWELFQRFGADIGVVLLDLSMPGMGGVKLAERVHNAAPLLPVVICSGHPEDEVPPAIRAWLGGYLRKPFRIAEMRDVLASAGASGGQRGARPLSGLSRLGPVGGAQGPQTPPET